MNNIMVSDNIKIENMIYEIRGKQVMLDSDLAKLYGCKNGTKSLNLAVKRNIERFPQDFYFQINKNEYDNRSFKLKLQVGICMVVLENYHMYLLNRGSQC